MCIIYSIFKQKENPEIQKQLIDLFFESQKDNTDGIGIVAFDKNLKLSRYIRTFIVDYPTIEKVFDKSPFINIHFRNGTSGEVNQKNIHFWKKGDWFFSHNGTCTTYKTILGKKTDSLIFFEKLFKRKFLKKNGKIEIEKIRNFLSGLQWWGRFVLINQKSKKIYFFGSFESYLLGDNCLIISSTKIQLPQFDIFNFWDLKFYTPAKKYPIYKRKLSGVFMMDLKTKKFKQIADKTEKEIETTVERYNPKTGRMEVISEEKLEAERQKAMDEYNKEVSDGFKEERQARKKAKKEEKRKRKKARKNLKEKKKWKAVGATINKGKYWNKGKKKQLISKSSMLLLRQSSITNTKGGLLNKKKTRLIFG